MARLTGKVAFVTGAPSPLAVAVSRALAAEGAATVLGGSAGADIKLDVLDPAECERAVQEVVSRHGRLDVLINLGACDDPALGRPLHEVAEAEWDRAIAETLRSALLVSRAAVPVMRAAGGGSIVNVSHAAALVGIPGTSLLAATTGALVNMTRAMAATSQDDKIRVNCVCAGSYVGGAFRPIVPSLMEQQRADPVPPGEIAPLFAFLASDESRHVNGQIVPVDDGITAWRLGG